MLALDKQQARGDELLSSPHRLHDATPEQSRSRRGSNRRISPVRPTRAHGDCLALAAPSRRPRRRRYSPGPLGLHRRAHRAEISPQASAARSTCQCLLAPRSMVRSPLGDRARRGRTGPAAHGVADHSITPSFVARTSSGRFRWIPVGDRPFRLPLGPGRGPRASVSSWRGSVLRGRPPGIQPGAPASRVMARDSGTDASPFARDQLESSLPQPPSTRSTVRGDQCAPSTRSRLVGVAGTRSSSRSTSS